MQIGLNAQELPAFSPFGAALPHSNWFHLDYISRSSLLCVILRVSLQKSFVYIIPQPEFGQMKQIMNADKLSINPKKYYILG